MKKGGDNVLVTVLLDRERARDDELARLRAEVARLKAPPTLDIIHHDGADPHPYTVQLHFEWQGWHHRSMVDEGIWKREPGYREHCFKYGVESCVRALAEAMLPTLVETEETFEQHYRRMRTEGKEVRT